MITAGFGRCFSENESTELKVEVKAAGSTSQGEEKM
jgi:hypothetical protein